MAQKLVAEGYRNVYALRGGWKEWVNAGYPVEKK
jgi:rhodanese-related sulfurtransferase